MSDTTDPAVPKPPAVDTEALGAMSSAGAAALAKEYWVKRRQELQQQVAEIEKFIGFAETSEELAVRVAKIEAFLGINK